MASRIEEAGDPELRRRVFEIDVLRCEHCGARRRLIALITDLLVARPGKRILSAPPRASVRGTSDRCRPSAASGHVRVLGVETLLGFVAPLVRSGAEIGTRDHGGWPSRVLHSLLNLSCVAS